MKGDRANMSNKTVTSYEGILRPYSKIIVILSLSIIFFHSIQPISASSSLYNLHFSETEGRSVLTDGRGNPIYVAGVVYDPVECGHTGLVDIDNDLKMISDAHFNVVRLKTNNDLEVTERVLDTADKYYPELQFIVSFKPYEYSTDVIRGMDFQGNTVGVDWANPMVLINSRQFAKTFVSTFEKYSNIWAWEIFEDITLGEYIADGQYFNGYWNTASGRSEFKSWMYVKYNGDLDALNADLDLWFYTWDDLENNAIYPNFGIIGCGDPWRSIFIEFPSVYFGIWVSEIVSAIKSINSKYMVTGSLGDELYISGVPIDKILEWGLDFPSLKSYDVNGKSLLLATAAADINDKPVLISEWGVQTAYLDEIQFAESEENKADLISSQLLLFASNSRIMGSCYFSLYDSKYLKSPDYGLIDIYGNPKKSYYLIKKMNDLFFQISEELATRSWDTSTAILLTSDAIYPPVTWDEEFINLFDELYRMGVHPCILGENELQNTPEYLAAKYDHIFAVSRIYSFGSFSEANFIRLEEFVERFPGNTLIMLPVIGMYGRNASYQEYSEFHSRKLCGYLSGWEGPSNIWNLWGNDGKSYEFSVTWENSTLSDETFSGAAKWHWNDYKPNENLVDILVENDQGCAALTVHELDSGSKVIALYPDVYVNELPPSVIDSQGNRSAHIFTYLILEYLGITCDPELEAISYEIGDYRFSSFYDHTPSYDTTIWGSKEPKPVFDDVIGSFKYNLSFVARITTDETGIITETSTPSTFIIELPSTWKTSRSWLHVVDENGDEVSYKLAGNTVIYQTKHQGVYQLLQYESIPVGVWMTRGLFILIILILVTAWIKTAIWTIKNYGGFKKQKVKEIFKSLSNTYPFKAYAIISPSKKIALKSDNWIPEPDEMLKLFDEDSNRIALHGYEYDVILKDFGRGLSAAQKENLGVLVGVEVGDSVLVTWSPSGSDINQAKNGSIIFANQILK